VYAATVDGFSKVSNGADWKAPIAGQLFGAFAYPPFGRVSRWPQPALVAQYSQLRQVSTE
jgi:hypothetical protein